MGSRVEYVNVSGLRLDGRRPREVRRVACQLGVSATAEGSAIVEQGLTKVLALVSGPREAIRRFESEHDQAILTCRFSVAPFAGSDRRKRRAGDRRLQEASAALQQCFESVVQTRLYPRSEIDINVLVLQSDGSALAAAINAVTLALIDAGVGMSDFVCASSAVRVARTALLDPTFVEASSGGAELTVGLLPASGAVSLASMNSRLPLDELEGLMGLASAGAQHVYAVMAAAVREHTQARLDARGGSVAQ